MNKPKISIIIPTYNRKERLKRVLNALQNQTIPVNIFEVVVVSDGSTDGTNDYLAEMETKSQKGNSLYLTAFYQTNQGVAVARNQGIRIAIADLILFIDDDVIPTATLVEEHLNFQPRDAIVLGPMCTPLDVRLRPWVLWEQRMLEKQYDAMIKGKWEPSARQFYTGNTSLYKKYLIQSGGFDPSFRRAEDVELAYRLKDIGCTFLFDPKAVGYHYADRSFSSWKNSATAYGKNDVIMARQKGHAWLLPTVLSEYSQRNWMVRMLVKTCLSRPLLVQISTYLLYVIASIGYKFKVEKIFRPALSGIFNLYYYQGITDELGDRQSFWKEMSQSSKSILDEKGQNDV